MNQRAESSWARGVEGMSPVKCDSICSRGRREARNERNLLLSLIPPTLLMGGARHGGPGSRCRHRW